MIVYPDPNAGDKSGGVGPPPQPPITVRTMDSDIKSMQENGGGSPQEELINAPRPPIRPEAPRPTEDDMKIKIPGYSGPEKSVFSSVSLPSSERGVNLPNPAAPQSTTDKGGALGKIIALLVTVVVAALIGAGLYFYVYPLLLTPNQSPEPTVDASPSPTETASSPSPSSSAHVSLVKASKSEEASSMAEAKAEVVEAGSALIKEIIIKKNGGPVVLSNYFPAIITELSSADMTSVFNEDYTAFIYYDDNGAWPGYILKRKQEVTPFVAQNTFRKIETSKSLYNLYLFNVGAKQGEFKSGNYNGIDTHYAVFESKGASLNYAWKEDLLIITTTFPALKTLIDGGLAL